MMEISAKRRALRLLPAAALVLLVIRYRSELWGIATVFALAGAFSVMLTPLCTRLERRGMKHDVKQMQAPMRLINVQKIEPPVKLYITYFTLYPADGDHLENYPDIYGYDDVIQQEIQPFIRHDI